MEKTGKNGSINGHGQYWWKKYHSKLLNHTRGPLVQIMWSSDVVFANITLRDSPFWTLHPYDCKNVTITNMTILALFEAPNTDGMILIRYGTTYGRPSKNILICNLTIRSMVR
ncbi:BnaCnng24610D [Brassica napus]|uniref:BnaCnng24610D protein n=1 Tax=Brassica napus TaxID=3708 RepID=A0A078IWA1_BRANA|nr:BnaCnng24610D [Brassica napus]